MAIFCELGYQLAWNLCRSQTCISAYKRYTICERLSQQRIFIYLLFIILYLSDFYKPPFQYIENSSFMFTVSSFKHEDINVCAVVTRKALCVHYCCMFSFIYMPGLIQDLVMFCLKAVVPMNLNPDLKRLSLHSCDSLFVLHFRAFFELKQPLRANCC